MDEIDTSIKLNNLTLNKKYELMDLPENLISIIYSYSMNYNILIHYRIINKKSKRIIENLIFQNVIIYIIFIQCKDNNQVAEYYKKNLVIFNKDCEEYFRRKIIPYISNADGLYELINDENNLYTNFYNYCYNIINDFKNKYGFLLKEKNFQKSLKRCIDKIIIRYFINQFKKKGINELIFDKLIYKNQTFNFIISIIKEMNYMTYINLSGFVFENDDAIYDLLNIIDKREEPLTIELKQIFLTRKMIQIIKDIELNDIGKVFIIDKKYNGILHQIDKNIVRQNKKTKKQFIYFKKNNEENDNIN